MSNEQDRLLSTQKLQLSRDIVRGQLRDEYMILKNVKSGAYLTVDKEQWRILQRFRDGACVAEILPQLILNRSCPRLRHFYELILKAEKADVLIQEGRELKRMRAVDWRLNVNWEFIQLGFCTAAVFTLMAFTVNGLEAPGEWWQWLLVWPVMLLGDSLSNILAACALRNYDCEVYRARLEFRKLFPSFTIDTRDARMGGKDAEVAVSLARLIPLVFLPGLACFLYAPLAFPLLLVLFYYVNPFGRNPGMQLLIVLYRQLRSSIEHEPLFIHGNAWKVIASGGNRWQNKRFILAHWAHTMIWFILLYWSFKDAFALMDYRILNMIHTIGPVQVLFFGLLVFIAFTLVPALGNLINLILSKHERLHNEPKRARQKRKYHGMDPSRIPIEDIQTLLGDSLLFHDCSDETIAHVAQSVVIEKVRRGTLICKENEPGDAFYILHVGKVEVLKEMPSGRPEQVCVLKAGDAFGEIALLRDVPRTRTVRALCNTILLSLQREEFNKLLIPSISADRIQQILQKLAFLNRIELCREWPVRALQLFASRAVIKEVASGERVIQAGTANQYFYIVYEGSFDVLIGRKRQTRLRVGDFFGEISLLQSSLSIADVVAHSDSRLLVVNKTDFLSMMGWDHFIGMQFERISSERLHEPIFPLKGRSFEAIDAV